MHYNAFESFDQLLILLIERIGYTLERRDIKTPTLAAFKIAFDCAVCSCGSDSEVDSNACVNMEIEAARSELCSSQPPQPPEPPEPQSPPQSSLTALAKSMKATLYIACAKDESSLSKLTTIVILPNAQFKFMLTSVLFMPHEIGVDQALVLNDTCLLVDFELLSKLNLPEQFKLHFDYAIFFGLEFSFKFLNLRFTTLRADTLGKNPVTYINYTLVNTQETSDSPPQKAALITSRCTDCVPVDLNSFFPADTVEKGVYVVLLGFDYYALKRSMRTLTAKFNYVFAFANINMTPQDAITMYTDCTALDTELQTPQESASTSSASNTSNAPSTPNVPSVDEILRDPLVSKLFVLNEYIFLQHHFKFILSLKNVTIITYKSASNAYFLQENIARVIVHN